MANPLELVIRRFAKQVRSNGVLCLMTDGDPALVAAFAALGWSDPYPIEPVPVVAPLESAAMAPAPERATLNSIPKKRG